MVVIDAARFLPANTTISKVTPCAAGDTSPPCCGCALSHLLFVNYIPLCKGHC